MTYTQLINSVLRRLRESEVATPASSDYAALIGTFVNEAKREVEDAWNWTALRTSIPVTTAQSDYDYTLTGAGKRYKTLFVYNSTSKAYLSSIDHAMGNEKIVDATEGQPTNYFYKGISSGDPVVYLTVVPDGVYTINFNLVIPQGDFSVGTEELSVPDYPVILGAYAKAIAERGEDQGRTHGEAFAAYNRALGDAIAQDETRAPDETVWSYA